MSKQMIEDEELNEVAGGTNVRNSNVLEKICETPGCGFRILYKAGMKKVKCPKCKEINEIKSNIEGVII
ncbi:MAG: hypothetical protein K5888_10910 [Lachnospiraceae bacterium]|nr:hypothetical protein [Lachnospiraceae bacterium]